MPPFLRPYVDVLGTCMLPDLEFHDYDSSTCSFRYFSPFLVSRCMEACMYAPPPLYLFCCIPFTRSLEGGLGIKG